VTTSFSEKTLFHGVTSEEATHLWNKAVGTFPQILVYWVRKHDDEEWLYEYVLLQA